MNAQDALEFLAQALFRDTVRLVPASGGMSWDEADDQVRAVYRSNAAAAIRAIHEFRVQSGNLLL